MDPTSHIPSVTLFHYLNGSMPLTDDERDHLEYGDGGVPVAAPSTVARPARHAPIAARKGADPGSA